MASDLKPCPFCGGEASIVGKRYEAKFCVGCDDDSCLGFSGLGWLYDSKQEAAEAWNRRSERTCRIAWNDADRIVRREDGGRMSEPNRDNVRTVSGNVGTASGIDRDALLALANDMQWSVDHQDGVRSIMRDFKRGKLSEDKIVEMLVLEWEKDAKTIREAVGE